jgi:hypothetical protein
LTAAIQLDFESALRNNCSATLNSNHPTMEQLRGDATSINSFEEPHHVIPIKSSFIASKKINYTTSAFSLTVIRIKTKSEKVALQKSIGIK